MSGLASVQKIKTNKLRQIETKTIDIGATDKMLQTNNDSFPHHEILHIQIIATATNIK
jgi:uncharacterized protein (UPF0248 family)